ncbi:hypothetical protein [Stenotrophomonas phage vB_SmaS_BUCT548]|uniref:Uncharacterized protein n=1 Tax=Stenotrophomonas phage vB_SmaS_BUCT548 TaxID=2712941 RepID=A0A7D2LHT8_9CAUD|nr:hypothetical protein PQD75_gp093 [Stenotrophomonas phage vB_SmaS_BUCT548]QIQ60779.1 hypothetical protein [Stenotrophomonas phage vB_SmaS_BUCT548]
MSNLSVEERDRYWWLLFAIRELGEHVFSGHSLLVDRYRDRWHRNPTELHQDLCRMETLSWLRLRNAHRTMWEQKVDGVVKHTTFEIDIRSHGYIQMNESRLCTYPSIAEEFLRRV